MWQEITTTLANFVHLITNMIFEFFRNGYSFQVSVTYPKTNDANVKGALWSFKQWLA